MFVLHPTKVDMSSSYTNLIQTPTFGCKMVQYGSLNTNSCSLLQRINWDKHISLKGWDSQKVNDQH